MALLGLDHVIGHWPLKNISFLYLEKLSGCFCRMLVVCSTFVYCINLGPVFIYYFTNKYQQFSAFILMDVFICYILLYKVRAALQVEYDVGH